MTVAEPSSKSVSADSFLAELFEELAARVQAGEPVDAEAYLARFPEHAEALRRLLPTMHVLADLGRSAARGDPVLPPADLESRTLGDFRILGEVGRGGMGVVYEAEQISLGRRVALKVLPFAGVLDPRQLARFKNEAQAAGQLHHPHIVPVYFVGNERGVHFYAMQFIDGHSLAAVIDALREGEAPAEPGVQARREPRPPVTTEAVAALTTEHSTRAPAFSRRVAEWGIQAAEALEHAHGLGIVHRDVKPANLLVEGEPGRVSTGSPRLWVTDFGLAQCQRDIKLTMTGDLLGTLRYMSPEQAQGKNGLVDARADVYALGATLYELLTLEPVFAGRDREELLRQITDDEPRPPRRLNPAVPPELDTIILKALAKEPAERYATAQELADDLRRFLQGEPIQARRAGRTEKLWRWCRRHPAVATLTTAVGLLLLAVTTLSVVVAVRSEQARQRIADEQAETERRRQEAEIVWRHAEAVIDFLVKALRSPDPTQDGRTVTVAEVLAQAVRQLQDARTMEPMTRARLLHAVGLTYDGLGLFQDAVPVFEQCLALQLKYLGPDDPDTLAVMNSLAVAYENAGRKAEALPLFEKTLKLRKAKLGPEHLDTLGSLNNLANVYLDTGRLAEAVPLLEEVLRILKARQGPEHPQTAEAMNNLAGAYWRAGRLAEAVPLYEEALRIQKTQLGPDHPRTLPLLRSLAIAYADAGRSAEALRLFEDGLRLCRGRLGPEHPQTLGAMSDLAVEYATAGRLEEAERLHTEALAAQKARLGPEHPDTLQSMDALGDCLGKRQKWEAATEVLRECLALRTRKAPDEWWAFQTRSRLGRAVAGLKQYAEAEKLLRDAHAGLLARRDEIPAPLRYHIDDAARWLAELYEAWGKPEQAEEWRRKLPPEVRRD